MWQEHRAEGDYSMNDDMAQPLFPTKFEEQCLAFKPYPLPFGQLEATDIFLRWERNSNFRQRYFELEELLEYAVERGKLDPPELTDQVKSLKRILYYTPPETVSALCEAEAELERLYAIVAQLVSPVNIISLRTTSEQYPIARNGWQSGLVFFLGSGSIASNFFRQFYWVGGLLTVLMVLVIFLDQTTVSSTISQINSAVTPFLFGAIGAWLYLYKTLTSYATSRILSRERIGFDWLRLFIGALVGGLIVLLFNNTTEFSAVSTAALGFLAGYSVDFFYQTLDQIIQRLMPKGRESASAPLPSPKQQQIESLIKQLKETDDEEDKIAIRNLLEKL
jgi:hypothetical protein